MGKYDSEITAEILTIGNELLKGSVLNTNARFLCRELTDLGFNCSMQVSCSDEVSAISLKLKEAMDRAHLIIVTGGLGPTPDDVTRDAVAEFFKVPLIFSKDQYARICRLYRHYGKKVPSLVRQEAMFPKNSSPLINRYGVALGFSILHENRLVVVLPGVPSELEKMYRDLVRPLVRRYFGKLQKKYALIVKTVGISEPDIMKRLGKDFFDRDFEFGIYPEAGEVSLRIYSNEPKIIQRLKSKVKRRLRAWIYALEDISLAETIGKILSRRKKSLAVAESCTGGLLSSELTKVSGASVYFKGGVVSYADSVKETVLSVSRFILKKDGAVSKSAAVQMASGIKTLLKTDYALSVTGIAGPTGGTKKKPVGQVWIGLADPRLKHSWRHHFWGDRQQVQNKAVKKSLEYLWRHLVFIKA